ncbi:hypothetical protein [Vibrio coralliilyticus]|uniref:hypothetical protein n=1 Tax=Vibrio coralliilyticus TaxID=190893 RepID=UPI000C167C9F|nr:hypothetical protein [Vibrio coralliilyticus]
MIQKSNVQSALLYDDRQDLNELRSIFTSSVYQTLDEYLSDLMLSATNVSYAPGIQPRTETQKSQLISKVNQALERLQLHEKSGGITLSFDPLDSKTKNQS